jgi:methylmalonyl-CoA/ethylmalonyl-CoA epimerase
MIKNIEHIGIAVNEAKTAIDTFTKLLNQTPYKQEEVQTEKVNTVFFQIGETKVELLEATEPESVIAKYVEKKGQGMHHIAIEVSDINEEMKRLQAEGFVFINETPKKGADNKLICFLHPKCTCGVLVELCQTIS